MSYYAAFNDNPILNVDFLGDKDVVSKKYLVETATSRSVYYYRQKDEFQNFTKEWNRAKASLRANGFGYLVDGIEQSTATVNIVQAKDMAASLYERTQGGTLTIYYNPRGGLLTTLGKRLAPIVVLAHEMDHCGDDLNDHTAHAARREEKQDGWDNAEEKRVIQGVEQRAAEKYGNVKPGEMTRRNHDGSIFRTTDFNNNSKAVMGEVPIGDSENKSGGTNGSETSKESKPNEPSSSQGWKATGDGTYSITPAK